MNNFMKGVVQITDNFGIISEILRCDTPDIKIISLDEDNKIPLDHPNVIGGTCLLPPIDALIAEADGDRERYNMHYLAYFNSPYIKNYINALIYYLYSSGNIIIFIPDCHTNTYNSLIDLFWGLYGIGISNMNKSEPQKFINPCYDYSCIPIWLNGMINDHIISSQEYLYNYPDNAEIPYDIMIRDIIPMIQPYGKDYNEKYKYVKKFSSDLKKNIKIQNPIIGI